MQMKVMKFGGTSVGSASGIGRVKEAVAASDTEVVVVVSALGGVTDHLLTTARMAAGGDKCYYDEFVKICDRHTMLIREIFPDGNTCVVGKVEAMLTELENIFRGVYLIKDLSQKTTDTILSYGERISSTIICGVIPDAVLIDARGVIKTNNHFHRHIVDFDATDRLIRERFKTVPKVSIMPGYIASDLTNGDVTTLGRGGSDYTAAIIAATLEASILEIWTDVDGFMTADPKVISNAYVIERLTFVEAMELCNFGARVIYPPTIFPVYHKNIPVRILNTYNPASGGTLISREKSNDADKAIKGISSVDDTCLITIRGLGMVGVIGVNYRIFKSLAKAGISVFFVSQAASENTTSIGVRNIDADVAVKVLADEFRPEIESGEINKIREERNLATVAIVGENMKHTPGIAGKLFGTLGRNGINVIACAQGASETNISFVISVESLRKALNVIHDSFFLSEYQVLNVFIAGVGLVGRHLLEQIRLQQSKLLSDNALQLRIVGITNSRRFIIDRDGIDLATYENALKESSNHSSPEIFASQIEQMNIFNSVFVDCTASEHVASIYKRLLDHNVSVVAANKVAASSDYGIYDSLKQTARKRGIKYLFETNVGAGLPIINTINALINSGDRILKIEAVVSGTLNYIFNVMSDQIPLSRAIEMAREAGYAEPDPRIDLSGTDVIRKLVILAREAGYHIGQGDIERKLFIPGKYFAGTQDDFWRSIPELDTRFEEGRKRLVAEGKCWRFVATLDNGKAEVALREVDSSSPFYHLEGSNNVILLTTERYKEFPMQIKGYGAGAGVTAAGVFADIISIANIR